MRLVKICGINSEAAFDTVMEAKADYLGFVFFEASPRYVTGVQARLLSERASGGPPRVGLFVNPALDEVDDILQSISLDILQIHGSPELVASLRDRFGRPVWRAVGAQSEADFPAASEVADGFLLEAKPPKGATRPGGNAVLADWALLAKFRPAKPWLLAGGLTPENVAQGLLATGAPGADVSSGVESAPGVKDPQRIRDFIAAVRGVEPV